MRDEREAWVAELGRIIHQDDVQQAISTSPQIGEPFPPAGRLDVPWTRHLTLPGLLDLVASRSYIITLPPARRAAVLAAVAELVHRHPSLDPGDIPMPYLTRCSRTHLPR